MAVESTMLPLGTPAPHFELTDTVSGDVVSLETLPGKAVVVMFICNHCPYVKAVLDRLLRDTAELAELGVASVAIMSNDFSRYPQDGPEPMARLAEEKRFPFPYLLDESQAVARAYGAVCTPDFFGYDADLGLQYRGRIDAGGIQSPPADAPRELFDAMVRVARTGRGPTDQVPSIGCSIKWRQA